MPDSSFASKIHEAFLVHGWPPMSRAGLGFLVFRRLRGRRKQSRGDFVGGFQASKTQNFTGPGLLNFSLLQGKALEILGVSLVPRASDIFFFGVCFNQDYCICQGGPSMKHQEKESGHKRGF